MNNIKKVELFQAFHSGSNRSHKQKKIQADRDPNTADLFTRMTDAQRHMFSHKLSEMPEMSQIFPRYRELSAICCTYC